MKLLRKFSLGIKKCVDSLASKSETSENVLPFVSFGLCIYIQYFFDAARKL